MKPRGSPFGYLRPLRTQYEVAKELGITRGAVSMTENRAFKKLRAALEALGIDGPAYEPQAHYSEGDDNAF